MKRGWYSSIQKRALTRTGSAGTLISDFQATELTHINSVVSVYDMLL
jgi:hypothetical protein